MKKRELEKLLQNSLPKQSPEFWDKIDQAYSFNREMPSVKRHVPWYRYAAAVVCIGLTVLVGVRIVSISVMNYTNVTLSNTVFVLPQQEAEAGAEPRIFDTVDDAWKQKYPDIEIMNEYLGVDFKPHKRTVILFGSLKSDTRQGVAEVISMADGVITDEKRFLSPEKSGAMKVTNIVMHLVDEDGQEWSFSLQDGFEKVKAPQPPIITDVDSTWKDKYPDSTFTSEEVDNETILLFGSLKSTPRKGVIQWIRINGDSIEQEEMFLSPEEHGALTVTEPGSGGSGIGVVDQDGIRWTVDSLGNFQTADHTMTLPQIINSSYAGKTGTEPQIIDNVEKTWETSDGNITITNGCLGEFNQSRRWIVLFGSLKSDPKQGVADVIFMNDNGQVSEQRFLCPEKTGALKVSYTGVHWSTMVLADGSGRQWDFSVYNGFDFD